MSRFIFVSIIVFLFAGCHQTTIRNNDPIDIKEATDFTRHFYHLIAINQIDSASLLFGEWLGFEKGKSLINKIKRFNGEIVETEITTVQTKFKQDENGIEKEYALLITVKYDSTTCSEQIDITNPSDTLKISGYHVKVNL